MVVETKTYAFLVSTSPKPLLIKSNNLSPKLFFWTSKQPFTDIFPASCNVCLVTIPEIFAQTQGSD